MVLTACAETTNNDYKFKGESEHWEAEYVYTGTEVWRKDNGNRTYSSEDSYQFILKYKGSLEELSSIRKLKYAHETTSSSGETTREFDGPPEVLSFTASGASKGGVIVREDEVIQVKVKWGDLEESFELHTKGK
ncbi:hypothetical protein I2484_09410 [Sporosarcina sp. E16_8]|nr:hypothetical protein [Sporosarcina sp. E16_8]